MKLVIAFDPGASEVIPSTVMLAACNVDYANTKFDLYGHACFTFGQRALIIDALEALARLHEIEAIVIEDFTLRANVAKAQIGSRFETVKVIERITCNCELLGLADRIVMQSADRQWRVNLHSEHYDKLMQFAHDPKRRDHYISAYKHLRYYIFARKIALTKHR